jgi:hypothetical protein
MSFFFSYITIKFFLNFLKKFNLFIFVIYRIILGSFILTYEKEDFSKIKFINFLIVILPLSLIVGNLATNINIILIIIFGFSIYKTEIFFANNRVYNFLLYLFFFYLILITFINNFENFSSNNVLYKEHFYKSISFLRFLFLFFVINKLLEKNVLNLKLLFLSFSSLSAIIAIDIIYQVILMLTLLVYP